MRWDVRLVGRNYKGKTKVEELMEKELNSDSREKLVSCTDVVGVIY